MLAEYVLFTMLTVAKRFHGNINNRLFRPLRDYHYMTELAGKTVGIMGVGRIGSAVAKHLMGFDVNVLGYAKNTKGKEGFSEIYHKETINDFVSQCDYVINTLPDSDDTRGLWDKVFFSFCRDNAVFINIGRDTIYHGNDFYNFLKTHRHSTAILDMFDLIPNPITNKYKRLSNVMVFPRVAAISKESDTKLKRLISCNLNNYSNGQELINVVI